MSYWTSWEIKGPTSLLHQGGAGACTGARQSCLSVHPVMVSGTFNLFISGRTARTIRFTSPDLKKVYQKWEGTDRALSLTYLKYISYFGFVHKPKLGLTNKLTLSKHT